MVTDNGFLFFLLIVLFCVVRNHEMNVDNHSSYNIIVSHFAFISIKGEDSRTTCRKDEEHQQPEGENKPNQSSKG